MQAIQRSEHYVNNGNYIVMTRTTVLPYAQMAAQADRLSSGAEDLVSPTNPPVIDDCRVEGVMLGWAYKLAPVRIRQVAE